VYPFAAERRDDAEYGAPYPDVLEDADVDGQRVVRGR
jgi:hypothetical protein